MALDRGTKIYAVILGLGLVALIFAIFYESPMVSRLNKQLAADPQIHDFPYPFRVLHVNNGVAIMSTPRSSAVPVAQVLNLIFPDLGNAGPGSPRFLERQKQLARVQTQARDLVLKHTEIKKVHWQVDRNWLLQHGVQLPGKL